MKRITTIVLFASIFAVAVGTLGFSGTSTSFLMAPAVPQSQENVGMLGHVEYKLFDDVGNIKAYMQNDNIVVEAGKDCAASFLFSDAGTVQGGCAANPGAFTYIGIGNGTVNQATTNPGVTNATLQDSNITNLVADCADNGSGVGDAAGGDMARRNVTAGIVTSTTSAVVTLETDGAGEPFTFVTANSTNVIDSAIFNGDYDTPDPASHTCGKATGGGTAGSDWSMFSRQLLNGVTGIAVSDGDSLSVKWTITVG